MNPSKNRVISMNKIGTRATFGAIEIGKYVRIFLWGRMEGRRQVPLLANTFTNALIFNRNSYEKVSCKM